MIPKLSVCEHQVRGRFIEFESDAWRRLPVQTSTSA